MELSTPSSEAKPTRRISNKIAKVGIAAGLVVGGALGLESTASAAPKQSQKPATEQGAGQRTQPHHSASKKSRQPQSSKNSANRSSSGKPIAVSNICGIDALNQTAMNVLGTNSADFKCVPGTLMPGGAIDNIYYEIPSSSEGGSLPGFVVDIFPDQQQSQSFYNEETQVFKQKDDPSFGSILSQKIDGKNVLWAGRDMAIAKMGDYDVRVQADTQQEALTVANAVWQYGFKQDS